MIGFFGEVFRGIWNGTDVAIKVFLEQDLTAENMEDFCNEITILRYLFIDMFMILVLFYSYISLTLSFLFSCVCGYFSTSSRLRHPNGTPLLLPLILTYLFSFVWKLNMILIFC